MKKIAALLRSIEIFAAALGLGVLHWQTLIYLGDRTMYGDVGIILPGALLAAGCFVGGVFFRRGAGCEIRSFMVLALLGIWQFRELMLPGAPALEWLVAAGASLVAGAVTAFFLRGNRQYAAPAALGYCAAMAAMGAIAWELPWLLAAVPAWSGLLALGGMFAIGLGALVANPLKGVKLVWIAVVLALGGVVYLGGGHLDLIGAVLADHYRDMPETRDGLRRYSVNANGSGYSVTRYNGELTAEFPLDLDSRPAMLPALLQFENHNLQVLAVATPLSTWPLEIARCSWVDHVDHLSNDPALAEFDAVGKYAIADIRRIATPFQLDDFYDFIAVGAGDPAPYAGRLSAAGVLLVAPPADSSAVAELFPHRMAVPGPGGAVLFSHRELTGDLDELDARMCRITVGKEAPPLPTGVLEILYTLPVKPPAETARAEFARVPDLAGWLALPSPESFRTHWLAWALAAAALLALRFGRFLLERWSDWRRSFDDIDAGIATALALALIDAALVQLGMPLYIRMATPGAAAVFLLTREELPRPVRRTAHLLVWLAPLAGVLLAGFKPVGTLAAGAVGLLAVNLWNTGSAGRTEGSGLRFAFGLTLGFGVLLAALNLPAGLFWSVAALMVWRRMSL